MHNFQAAEKRRGYLYHLGGVTAPGAFPAYANEAVLLHVSKKLLLMLTVVTF